jgi:hypothetical protein
VKGSFWTKIDENPVTSLNVKRKFPEWPWKAPAAFTTMSSSVALLFMTTAAAAAAVGIIHRQIASRDFTSGSALMRCSASLHGLKPNFSEKDVEVNTRGTS